MSDSTPQENSSVDAKASALINHYCIACGGKMTLTTDEDGIPCWICNSCGFVDYDV